jgi:hypothetical protein
MGYNHVDVCPRRGHLPSPEPWWRDTHLCKHPGTVTTSAALQLTPEREHTFEKIILLTLRAQWMWWVSRITGLSKEKPLGSGP